MFNKRHYQGRTLALPILGKIPLSSREIWIDIKMRHDCPLWAQFTKYVVFGFSSVCIFFSVFLFVENVWPEYLNKTILDKETLQFRMSIVLAIAFVPANLFAYFTNRAFVFIPGKHSFQREFMLFMIISAISFTGGEIGKRWIIELGLPNILAAASFAGSSAVINFIARKLIVFDQ